VGSSPDDFRADADILRASARDAVAFRTFYERHAHDVLRWLRSRVNDDRLAEDLLSETFAQAWLWSGRFRDERGGSAQPWLFGIARHVLLESFRKRRVECRARERLGIVAPRAELDPASDLAERLDATARRSALARALSQLPAEQRQAVGLHVVAGLPYSAVAGVMGSSESLARMRVMRGLRRLRTLLGRSKDV
jgi:RNA polymerase sigma-70 factor (ECF subfamily)